MSFQPSAKKKKKKTKKKKKKVVKQTPHAAAVADSLSNINFSQGMIGACDVAALSNENFSPEKKGTYVRFDDAFFNKDQDLGAITTKLWSQYKGQLPIKFTSIEDALSLDHLKHASLLGCIEKCLQQYSPETRDELYAQLNIEFMVLQDAKEIEELIQSFHTYEKKTRAVWSFKADMGVYGTPTVWDLLIGCATRRLDNIQEPLWNDVSTEIGPFNENMSIHGYKMYEVDRGVNIVTLSEFKELVSHRRAGLRCSLDEFIYPFEQVACSDWRQMDVNGKSFQGAWLEENGSAKRKFAAEITYHDNCEALWKLPYPTAMLIETIKIGCSKRLENVRYSNFLCHWVCMKDDIMQKVRKKSAVDVKPVLGQ